MLVSDDTVVISMTAIFAFQGFHEFFHRKIPGFAQPFFQSLQGAAKAVSGRFSPDLRSVFAVLAPTIRESEKIELFASDEEPVETKATRFLRGQCKLKLPESLFQRLLKLSGLIVILKSTYKVINIPDDFRLPSAFRFYHVLEPEIKSIMQVDICQNRRDDAALRCSGFRMQHGQIRLKNSGFQPFADQSQNFAITNPLLKHSNEPIVVHGVKETANVGFDNPAIGAELKHLRQLCRSALRALLGAITETEVEKILLVYRFENVGDSTLNNLVFQAWYAERPKFTVAFRNVFPANGPGTVRTVFEPGIEIAQVFLKVGFISLPVDVVYTGRGILFQLKETGFEIYSIEKMIQILETMFP